MRHLSIRTRLTIWYTAVLSLGLILFSVTVWIALRQILNNELSANLLNQAKGLEEYLHIEDSDRLETLVDEIDEYSRSLPQRHFLAVSYDSGAIIYRSAGAADAQLGERSGLNEPRRLRWSGHHFLAVSRSVSLRKGTVRMFLALSSESSDRAVELLGFVLLAIVPLFIICAAGGGYWLSRRALQPVDRITERARAIGVANLSERLPVVKTDDELQRLTETWNEMLERIETAVSRISQFTADASHELRTPVAIIRFAAESALRKLRSEAEYRAALERVRKESENMTRLLESLLFLAQADVDQGPADMEQIELRSLLETACTDLAPLASEKNISLIRDLPASSVSISGSFSGLRRMLLILLDNSIKYTPANGEVSVRLRQSEGQAIVTVEDTGIGIPEEARTRVFQRFFRVDASRNKQSGGYGLGLAIAQTIVQQHKASIEVRPKSGGGCIFSVSLPLAA